MGELNALICELERDFQALKHLYRLKPSLVGRQRVAHLFQYNLRMEVSYYFSG
jgi:hypothetical protein